ncbi:MAG: SAM-dependent methyltransferase [Sneathiella sp.]|uniref:class I SAM-dependent methyltransferase n=1 Tax=Sneathiella sp. TaxID=1964365 RepID=UPI000C4356EF|nr:class I SAM-dependent methyltransferase [Sneathiella sp.]MAZ02853.1 SAM-dependent methyltransferase [Sneathiella sp.]
MRPISPWIEKHATLIPKGQPVIDVACGGGRHSLFLLEQGHEVLAVDVDTSAIASFKERRGLTIIKSDLEGAAWPFTPESAGAIVVVNYLWRPLFPYICEALSPGGILLYDTFAQGNEKYGRPRNPDFLLAPGELIERLGETFDILDSFDGYTEEPVPACRQSIAARKRA